MLTSQRTIAETLSHPDSAWLACAIDGEGSVNFRRDKRHRNAMYFALWFCNTNREFAERFAVLTGGRIYSRPPRGFGKRQQYEVYVTSKARVGRALGSVIPYLIVKREKARRLLAWIQEHPNGRGANITGLNKPLPRDNRGSNISVDRPST